MKIYMVSLLHRATIKKTFMGVNKFTAVYVGPSLIVL